MPEQHHYGDESFADQPRQLESTPLEPDTESRIPRSPGNPDVLDPARFAEIWDKGFRRYIEDLIIRDADRIAQETKVHEAHNHNSDLP